MGTALPTLIFSASRPAGIAAAARYLFEVRRFAVVYRRIASRRLPAAGNGRIKNPSLFARRSVVDGDAGGDATPVARKVDLGSDSE
jgi:hypothetical protein